RDGEDGAVCFHVRVVAGDRAAGPFLLGLVVAREVRADRLPVLAAVTSAEDHLRAVIHDLRIEWRSGDRRGPLKAVLHVFAAVARWILGPRAHVAGLLRSIVVARDDAQILSGIDDVRIARVGVDVAGLAAADVVPVGEVDGARQAVARPLRSAQVLHRAGDVVGTPAVDRHVIELRNRQRRREPGRTAIAGDVYAAVVGSDHPLRIPRIDPDVVVISVRQSLDVLDRLPTVD